MFCASPQRAEPIRNTTRPTCSTILRPYWSPSLPYSGVTIVCASRYAVTTHEMWSKPPRSPTIVGRAVETIVLSSAASSITSTRPAKTTYRWRDPASSTASAPDSGIACGASTGPSYADTRGRAGAALAAPALTALFVRDLGRDVGRNIEDLLLGQLAPERRHPTAAVCHLLDDLRLILRFRNGRQIGSAIA